MTNIAICARPDVDPQDWFIRSDGKQYSDDDLLTDTEHANVCRSVLTMVGEDDDAHNLRVLAALNAARSNRKRAALIRRRKAKEACLGCDFRENCLEQALTRVETHGTWGGFLEEELDEIRKEQARRRRRKGAQEPTLLD